MPNPSSDNPRTLSLDQLNELIDMHSDAGDDRMAMWLAIKSGELDNIAPLTTEEGVHMRLELIHELTMSALLLKATDWLPNEVVDAISWGIWDMTVEARTAAEALGLSFTPLTDLASPAEFGIERPE